MAQNLEGVLASIKIIRNKMKAQFASPLWNSHTATRKEVFENVDKFSDRLEELARHTYKLEKRVAELEEQLERRGINVEFRSLDTDVRETEGTVGVCQRN